MNSTGVVSLVNLSMPPRTPKMTTTALINRNTVCSTSGRHAEEMKPPNTAECSSMLTAGSENDNVSDLRKYSMDQPPTTL